MPLSSIYNNFPKTPERRIEKFLFQRKVFAHQLAGKPRECGEFRRMEIAVEKELRNVSVVMASLFNFFLSSSFKLSRVRRDLKPGLTFLVYDFGTRSKCRLR